MIPVLLWAVFAVSLTVLQTTVAGWLGAGPVTPDLIMAACILLAVYTDGDELHFLAPALGVLRDLYAGGVPGQSVLVLSTVVYLIRRDKHRLDFDSYLLDLTVVLATLLDGSVAWSLRRLISPWPLDTGWLWLNLIGRSLAGMLLVEVLRLAWREWLQPWMERRAAETRRFNELEG